jgi:hypothetical protein
MIVAVIALFVALGGSAAALSGSNTVQSDDLGPGSQVTAPDVAANAVNGSDVVDNSISGADVNESSLGTVPNASKVGGLPPSSLTKGRAVTKSLCSPPANGTFADCGTVTINLDKFSRLFVVARGSWLGVNDAGSGPPGAADAGVCRIGVNGAPFGPDVEFGEIDDSHSLSGEPGEVTLTNMVDPNLAPGPHTIGLACRQGFNGVQTVSLTDITLSVGVLGSA